MIRRLRFIFPALGVLLVALPAGAKTVRIATFNIEMGPNAPGTTDYAATKAVLGRIDADVVGFQEILHDFSTNCIPNWQQLAAELAYPHVAVGTSASGELRLGFFSRFPIVETNNLASVWPASEFARRPMRVVIAVPGAAKPLVVWNMHHKADEPESPDTDVGNGNNQLRRAVEALRITQDMNNYRSNNPTHDEFVMLGDLNDSIFQTNAQFEQFSQSQYAAFKANSWLLPSSYAVGSDVPFPILYRPFPDSRYAAAGLQRLDLRQQNGMSVVTRPRSSRTLDYLLVSPAIRTNALGEPRGEIYNSELDWSGSPGLPKAGQALASGTSALASDHLAAFADIHMANAGPAAFISSFSPVAGMPGASVSIEGVALDAVNSVRFGGIQATFTIIDATRIVATVPQGAVDGPISVSANGGTASSFGNFYIAVAPSVASAFAVPAALTGFMGGAGSASPPQSVAISAAGLGGPLQVFATAGFEVSLDGASYSSGVTLAAPARSDASSNYAGDWSEGGNAGRGFGPWAFVSQGGGGAALAYFGNPADSQVAGMGSKAFALRAEPADSGAVIDAVRRLEQPLAVGEALSFDWGVNWDAGAESGNRGFVIKSGSAFLLSVRQGNYPGSVELSHGASEADTGLAYGTSPMRWTFTQLDAQTLGVTATARTNSALVAYTTNIPVAGAVNGFIWFAEQTDPATNRRTYYDKLEITPVLAGGGALSASNVLVRLASNAPTGNFPGILQISSEGQVLTSVSLRAVPAPSPTPTPVPTPSPSPSPTPTPTPSPTPGPTMDRKPPSLHVTAPAKAVVTTQATRIRLEGTATDNVSPDRVQVRIKAPSGTYGNWEAVNLAAGNAKTKSWWHWLILDRKGEWAVRIRALDARNNTSEASTITIRRR